MRIFNFNAETQRRRGFVGFFKALVLSVMVVNVQDGRPAFV